MFVDGLTLVYFSLVCGKPGLLFMALSFLLSLSPQPPAGPPEPGPVVGLLLLRKFFFPTIMKCYVIAGAWC